MTDEERTIRARETANGILAVLRALKEYQYPYLYWYLYKLEKGELFGYAEKLFSFVLERKHFLMYRNQFRFFVSANHNSRRVREKGPGSNKTSFHLIKLLSALGVIWNVSQNDAKAMDINKIFKQDRAIHDGTDTVYMNIYAFHKLTPQRLRVIEKRAERLAEAEVTKTNISFCYLGMNGCRDLADELYPNNDPKAIEKKELEYSQMIQILNKLIDQKGFATKKEIQTRMKIKTSELQNLLNDVKPRMKKIYRYGRPTNEHKARFGIPKKRNGYIYTRIEEENKD